MSVVDHLLNSLVKRLQNAQKARKKQKKKKRRAIKKSPKIRRFQLQGKSATSDKPKRAKRKKRAPGRSVKRIFKKPSKSKKKTSRKKSPRPKTRPKGAKKVKKAVKKVPKVQTASNEVPIGEVTHYFSRIQVIVLKMKSGKLMVGDRIHIVGRTTDFVQKVNSLQIESVDVKSAKKGQLVGLKVAKKAKPGDQVFKLTS